METQDIQFRILIPFKGGKLFDDNPYWAETCFGNFMVKVYFPRKETIKWFWYTRYQMPLSVDTFIKKHVNDDTDFVQKIDVKEKAYVKDVKKNKAEEPEYRCIYVRMSVDIDEVKNIKKLIDEQFESIGYKVIRHEDYDVVEDLGSDRFAPVRLDNKRLDKNLKKIRAYAMCGYLSSVCLMFFWALQKNKNGWYVPEKNSHPSNKTTKSTFEAFHHFFCNITDVPLFVFEKDGKIGTNIYPHADWDAGRKNAEKHKIQF